MDSIGHVEIAGKDGDKLEQFYTGLFKWKVNRIEAGANCYGMIDGAKSPSIGIRHEPDGEAEIVVYVEVDDVDQSVALATSLGAKVRIPPMQYGDLYFALVNDPEGNPIGMTKRKV